MLFVKTHKGKERSVHWRGTAGKQDLKLTEGVKETVARINRGESAETEEGVG